MIFADYSLLFILVCYVQTLFRGELGLAGCPLIRIDEFDGWCPSCR